LELEKELGIGVIKEVSLSIALMIDLFRMSRECELEHDWLMFDVDVELIG
jgi:hypothetical protein